MFQKKALMLVVKLKHLLLQSLKKLSFKPCSGCCDVAVVPDFVHVSGQLFFTLGIGERKSVSPGILIQPLPGGGVLKLRCDAAEVDGGAKLVLACTGAGRESVGFLFTV